uniref:Endothelin converting enzyme 2a n=1 Tax=Hucho hucho TaxID=62062 RepID=A0A4W5KVG0_9TELE
MEFDCTGPSTHFSTQVTWLNYRNCCGNSSMSSDMYDAGYHSITNIDYSSVCIDTMSARHDATCPGMTWHQMDARQLSFTDASYNVVLEKGTLDAMLVEEKDPWKVSSETACLIDQVLREVRRSIHVHMHTQTHTLCLFLAET